MSAAEGSGRKTPLFMPTVELLYASHRPSRTTDQVVVDDIVLPAMRFNREQEITGCLWFGPTRFVQILEGDADKVADLYARIEQDPRHEGVKLLHTAPIAERSFDRWSMRLIRGDEADEVERLVASIVDVAPRRPRASVEAKVMPIFDAVRQRLKALADGGPAAAAGI